MSHNVTFSIKYIHFNLIKKDKDNADYYLTQKFFKLLITRVKSDQAFQSSALQMFLKHLVKSIKIKHNFTNTAA